MPIVSKPKVKNTWLEIPARCFGETNSNIESIYILIVNPATNKYLYFHIPPQKMRTDDLTEKRNNRNGRIGYSIHMCLDKESKDYLCDVENKSKSFSFGRYLVEEGVLTQGIVPPKKQKNGANIPWNHTHVEPSPNLTLNETKWLTRTTKVYSRDPSIRETVILNAAGICQDCGRKHLSPEDPKYDNIKNIPELQCHHIEPLGSGGADTIANCVALCPNCHRKRHIILNEDLE